MRRKETNRVVFHHSLANYSPVNLIREWHLERGFYDIGYHYVILRDGTIQPGRDMRDIGAHASGKNRDSIGICFEGNFHKYKPSDAQLSAASEVYHAVCRAYSLQLDIDFHRPDNRDNNNLRAIESLTACPGPMLDRDLLILKLITEVII